jgi:hypothetical protein
MKEEIVKIPNFPYKNIYGALGIQTSNTQVDWERCRDRFQTRTEQNPVDHFLFYFKDGTADLVINFMKTVEAACKCPQDKQLVFKKTSNDNVLWVGINDWWKQRVRRSLLTALLRCGQNFEKDTGECFVNALNSEHYISTTKEAITAFLEGRSSVKMKKNTVFSGWMQFFTAKSREQIDLCLVRLARKKKEEAAEII